MHAIKRRFSSVSFDLRKLRPSKFQVQLSKRSLSTYIVTPKELHKELQTSSNIIPLCASWFMPNDPQKRTGKGAFAQKRLPKARFFDLDAVIDPNSSFPHMLPRPEDFAQAMGKLGIQRSDKLVIYDSDELGLFSAPRVGWTFKIFGHSNVHVLDNFQQWVAKGYDIETGDPSTWAATTYLIPELDQKRVVSFEELTSLLESKNTAKEVQILDARSHGRWSGKDGEPRPGAKVPTLFSRVSY
jgi:thiosulfate/3-mercaptopyruvate sulfurtransferase